MNMEYKASHMINDYHSELNWLPVDKQEIFKNMFNKSTPHIYKINYIDSCLGFNKEDNTLRYDLKLNDKNQVLITVFNTDLDADFDCVASYFDNGIMLMSGVATISNIIEATNDIFMQDMPACFAGYIPGNII